MIEPRFSVEGNESTAARYDFYLLEKEEDFKELKWLGLRVQPLDLDDRELTNWEHGHPTHYPIWVCAVHRRQRDEVYGPQRIYLEPADLTVENIRKKADELIRKAAQMTKMRQEVDKFWREK